VRLLRQTPSIRKASSRKNKKPPPEIPRRKPKSPISHIGAWKYAMNKKRGVKMNNTVAEHARMKTDRMGFSNSVAEIALI
jgi:hypothetical protein